MVKRNLLLLLLFIFLSTIFAAEKSKKNVETEDMTPEPSVIPNDQSSMGYTINFNNVSIIEYIHFVSKISKKNFIYEEQDLSFNVTIVSEEPSNLIDIITVLIHVLRINGFDLIEQGNNFIISKLGTVKNIAPVVSQKTPIEGGAIPPIMTRVFKVKNANLQALSNIIRPLLSNNAIVEVSEETRHLIITDITQNIEQIHRLFLNLDLPQAPLSISSYSTHNNSPEDLVTLATQILQPISEENPLIFIPQNSTCTLYIVSTPFLIEKAMAILEDLDSSPTFKHFTTPITGKNILLYSISHKPTKVLQDAMKQIENTLVQIGPPSTELVRTLHSMKYIRESHSLLFIGNPKLLQETQALLQSLDTASQDPDYMMSAFYIYKIMHGDGSQIIHTLKTITENLKTSTHANPDLIKTIESMKWIKESNSLLFTGNQSAIDQIKNLLPTIDIPIPLNNKFYSYTPIHETPEKLLHQVQEYHTSLKETNLSDHAFMNALASAKIIASTKSVIFTGDESSLARIHTLITSLDRPAPPPKQEIVYVYKIQHVDPEYVQKALQKLGASTYANDPLFQTIHTMQYILESHTLVFRGSEEAITHIKQILPTLDNVETAQENKETKTTYSVHQLQHASGKAILAELKQTAQTLTPSNAQNKAIIESINNIKWIASTNFFILTGTPPIIKQLQEIIATLDVQRPEKSSFYVYIPTLSPHIFQKNLLDTAQEMQKEGLADTNLIQAMMSAKLTSNNRSVIFTGTSQGIEKLKEIIHTFDSEKKTDTTPNEFFIYTPHSISVAQLKEEILAAAQQMEKSGLQDSDFLHALQSIKTEPSTNRVIFTGTVAAIEKIKVLVNTYDSHESIEKPSEYYIFKPTHQPPDSIIKQAQHAAQEMQQSNFKNPTLIRALQSATIVSKGTGVLFTGTSRAIAQIKTIIPTFDSIETLTSPVNKFFTYTPTHISAELLQKHINKVASHMQNNGFVDQEIINTLTRSRLISNGKALLFTGTSQSLKEIKVLLPSLDVPETSIKTQKEATFVIYKIQHIPAPTLMSFLRNMANDFHSAGSQEKSLITTLNNMRYVKDTNSIIFTGEASAIQSAVALAKQFDIPEFNQKGATTHIPSGFLLYKPKYLSGDNLIQILHEFKQNLHESGVDNQKLFDTINNVKWMERTSSILISGDDEDSQKILTLLERFDIPSPHTAGHQAEIAPLSDASFLIYKLQYHSGNDIQNAIKQIGESLGQEKRTNSANFIKTIQSLQWVEVTNSLIATGQSNDLGKLKELIQSIDTPLKQVFVEVLVIETTIGNQLTFGLRWGGQGTYKNKLGLGSYATPPSTPSTTDPLIDFNKDLNSISASHTPTGQFIPVASGFDLGVIGDVIFHKGTSYLALGALVNAVRTEGDTTIVMNQKLITQDNKQSVVFIGQNIPYAGSFVNNTGSRTVQTTNIEYRDVGVSLKITPTVGNDDVITLEIEEDISEATGKGAIKSSDNITGIITAKTSTKTVVSVPDKSFLTLSGSIQDTATHNRTGIPCLGGLPFIGAAFSENKTDRNTHNVIIFVRPQIIKTFDDYATITERQENLFRSQSSDEDFDAGLELIKTPDDTY